ncbi:hypothetical protein D9758_016108 [Tetrapyrgos nigripes]|uniref:Elongin-C n=1 Tax=Tetrapyrgos nigripes TaxID=182062 RepID=A0A8H5BZT6_9AGAR|nr:hypothetical protein D9758_018965 [Tetrapyrgos nigripes]KAF5332316.1 hypothetical protein D9758_016108 [Tetrapyrgos nigripes]
MAEQDTQMQANPEDWIRVVSDDGYSFLIKRKVANMSGTMKSSLDTSSGFSEAETKTYHAHDHRGIIVQKLLEYQAFKSYYVNDATKDEVPVNEFMERIPPEIVLELLLAGDYQEL